MSLFVGPFEEHIQNPQTHIAQYLQTRTAAVASTTHYSSAMDMLRGIKSDSSQLDSVLQYARYPAVLAVILSALSNTNPYINYIGIWKGQQNTEYAVLRSDVIDSIHRGPEEMVIMTRILGLHAVQALTDLSFINYEGFDTSELAKFTPGIKQWQRTYRINLTPTYDVQATFGSFWRDDPRPQTPDKKPPTKTPVSSGGDSGSLFLILIILAVGFVAVNQSYF